MPPHTSHPETFKLLPEGGAFYVTALIVGTEALAVKVGPKVLGKEEIDKLESDPMRPELILTVRGAGYKMRESPV